MDVNGCQLGLTLMTSQMDGYRTLFTACVGCYCTHCCSEVTLLKFRLHVEKLLSVLCIEPHTDLNPADKATEMEQGHPHALLVLSV